MYQRQRARLLFGVVINASQETTMTATTGFGRAQLSRLVWRGNRPRQVRHTAVGIAHWEQRHFIPSSTSALWRSARGFSR